VIAAPCAARFTTRLAFSSLGEIVVPSRRIRAVRENSIPPTHVIRRQLARVGAGLDLDGRVVHVIARAQFLAHFRHERVAGCPPGMTRCTVSAVSVVLIAQSAGRAPRRPREQRQVVRTTRGSMCSGRRSTRARTESRSRPQVLHTMAAAMTRPVSGSSHSQP